MSTRQLTCAVGFTVLELELVIALVILALALGMAATFPLTARPLHLAADTQDLAANLQVARELAQSRSRHYRIQVLTPTRYALERGQLDSHGITWSFPVAERTVSLRRDVIFDTGSVGLIAEFDNRGTLVTAPAPMFALRDRVRAWTNQVTVNTAGLVDKP